MRGRGGGGRRGSGTETPRQTPCKRPGEREDRAREEWTEEVPEARRGGKGPPAVGLPQAGADPDPDPRAQPGGVSPGLLPWPKGESSGCRARAPSQPQALRPRTEASVPRRLPAGHEASVRGRPACTRGPAPSALAQKAASGCGPPGVSLPRRVRLQELPGSHPQLVAQPGGGPRAAGKGQVTPHGTEEWGRPSEFTQNPLPKPRPLRGSHRGPGSSTPPAPTALEKEAQPLPLGRAAALALASGLPTLLPPSRPPGASVPPGLARGEGTLQPHRFTAGSRKAVFVLSGSCSHLAAGLLRRMWRHWGNRPCGRVGTSRPI